MNRIVFGDNLDALRGLPDGTADLIYVDPPFDSGKTRRHTRIRTTRSRKGDRTRFQGRRYETTVVGTKRFRDSFDDYLVPVRFLPSRSPKSPSVSVYMRA